MVSRCAGETSRRGAAADQFRTDLAVRVALLESRRQLTRFLRRRLGCADVAEEVLWTFIRRAVARSGRLREIGSLRGWLAQVLAIEIANQKHSFARRRRHEVAVEPGAFDWALSETDSELDETLCACLYRLLPTLRSEYADLIWRIDLAAAPRASMALARGVSLGTLAVRLHRARKALKRRLLEMCMTCPVHGFLDCRCDTARAASGTPR